MTRARNSANLASHGNLFVDITNDRTGIGSVVPAQNLHVAGTAGFHDDVTFTGDLYSTTWDRSANSLRFNDNAKLRFGTGDDANIRHDGSNTWIQNGTGYLYIDAAGSSSGIRLISHAHWQAGAMAAFYKDGGVVLYHDANQKFSTTAYGTNITGTTDTDGLIVSGVATVTTMNVTGVLTYDDVTSVDSVGIVTARQGVRVTADGGNTTNYISVGAGDDFRLFHDGTNTYLKNNTGDLYLKSSSADYIRGVSSTGAVELKHGNNTKFATTSAGGTLTGRFTTGSTTNLATNSIASSTQLLVSSLSGNNNFVDLTILGGRTGRSMVKFGDQDNYNVGSVQYFHNDNSLNFFTNGSTTSRLTLDSNGTATFGGDLSISDTIVHTGDTDTKIRFPSADRITLETGGSEKVGVANTGVYVNDEFTISGTNGIPLRITGDLGTGDNVYIQNNTSGGHVQFGLRTNDSDGNHHRAFITAKKGSGISANGQLELLARGGSGAHGGFIIDRGVGIKASLDLIPQVDSAYDLGTSSLRWDDIYVDDIDVSGSGTFGNDINVANSIVHVGDTDTSIDYGTNQISIKTGGTTRVSVGGTGTVFTDGVTISGNHQFIREGALGSYEQTTIWNQTSGGYIQIGLRQTDSDGAHHRAIIKASKGTGNVAGKFELLARGPGGGTNRGWIIDSGVGIQANLAVIPETDSTYDLGTSSVRWRNLYADTLYGDGSNLTGITQTAINNNADNRVITGSGTANTLNAESGLTYNGTTLALAAADDIRIAGGSWTGEYTGGIKIQPDASNAYFQYHGSLFFRNSGGANRFQLDSGGNGTFTGSVTATGGFSGSGASLTSVNAATLANVSIGSLLRSDAADTATGDISFAGGAGAVTINTNSDIRFGSTGSWSGEAVKLQHHADNLYIQGGTGGINLRGSDSGTMAHFGNTATTLYDPVTFNGGAGAVTITSSDIRSAGSSTWTGNPGASTLKIQAHSNRWYIVSNSNSSMICQFRQDGNDRSYVANDGQLYHTSSDKYWRQGNDGSGSGLDADTVDGLHAGSTANTGANQLVRTQGNGYIFSGYINTTSNDTGSGGDCVRFYASEDAYIRYLDKASMRSVMNTSAVSGSFGGRETVTTDTNYWVGSMGWGSQNFDTTVWDYGSGFIDVWNNPSGQPSGTSHWQALQAMHYTNQAGRYGFRIACGAGNPAYAYIQGRWNTTTNGWHKLWNAANDGSGSGLDADTCDGVHGTSFLRSDTNDTLTKGSLTTYSGGWNDWLVRFQNTNSTNDYVYMSHHNYGMHIRNDSSGTGHYLLDVYGSTGNRFQIRGSDARTTLQGSYILQTGLIHFDVKLTSGTSSGDIKFNNVLENVGSHYSTSTGRFTAPVAGVYHFAGTVLQNNSGSQFDVNLRYNNSSNVKGNSMRATFTGHSTIQISETLKMNANDYVHINVSSGSLHHDSSGNWCGFQGTLLG